MERVGSARSAWLLAICVLLTIFPIQMRLGFLANPIAVYDLAYALVAIALLARGITLLRLQDRPCLTVLSVSIGLVCTAVLVVFAAHPSRNAALIATYVLGTVLVGKRTNEMLERNQAIVLIRAIVGWIFVQFPVAVAQVVNDGAVLGRWASESEYGFRRIDGMLGASGTVLFANVLGTACALAATFLVVALAQHEMRKTDQLLCGVAIAAASAMVGLSLSRSAIVAHVIIAITTSVSPDRRKLAPVVATMLFSLAVSMVVRSDGWVARGQASVAGVETAGSGRMALNRQAIAVYKTKPVTGVGFGNYETTVSSEPEIEALSTEHLLVHNFALYVLATGGVVGSLAAVVVGLGILFAGWRNRNRVWLIGILGVIGSVMMLTPHFQVGTGFMWLGMLISLVIRPKQWIQRARHDSNMQPSHP
jgi:O-antigen ligase